jgi:hypothetical protein
MRLTTAALLCVIAVALAGCGEVAPSDKSMRETFLAKRQAFETLRTELCKLRYDLTINRDPPWTQPQIPAADEKRFLAEMDVLGARSVKYLRGCQLWIEIWSSGVDQSASYKKYRYGPPMFRIIEIKEPPPKDLNTYLDSRVRIASFEKNIEGDWWIELDHWR